MSKGKSDLSAYRERQNCEMMVSVLNYIMGGALGYYFISLVMASLLVAGYLILFFCNDFLPHLAGKGATNKKNSSNT